MRISTVFRKLLAVTAMVVRAVLVKGDEVVVAVSPLWRRPRCGECGKIGPIYDTCGERTWRHLALGRSPFLLRYAPRRVGCRTCGVRVEQVPWAAQGSRFTRDFEELAAYLAQRMDKTAVTKLLGISWRTVGAIVERIVAERLDPARLDGLTIIGVDELSFRRNHNYVTVVVDHLRSRVIWVGEGKSSEALGAFFTALGPERAKQLTHVTMDMSAAFIDAVNTHAPQAQKVFDRFHVQKLASQAVDEVRRAEVRAVAGTDEAKTLKHSRWALLKNPWNLLQRQGEKLAEVQRTNKRLYRAYLLKESLAQGLDYRQVGRAERHFDKWIAWAKRSKLKPFIKLAGTIKRLKDGILAYVETGLSNGFTEGMNNKSRLITRRAYGFHGAQALAAMIHLCCGGITLDPPIPSNLPTGTS
jgi:transposase